MNLSSIVQQIEAQRHVSTARKPEAQDAGSSSGASSLTASGGASITANDFLTLLVSELKNQDPTANTDPNAYIDQLVQVNSLQQLIAINGYLNGGGSSSISPAGASANSRSAITAAASTGHTGQIASH